MASWRRNTHATYGFGPGFNWEDAIGPGNSYLRVHIGWGFQIDAPITTDIQAMSYLLVGFGICTTIGDGTESRPNVLTDSGDLTPPTSRWIYWEARSPVVQAIDYDAGIISWRDSGATEPTQTRGQVLATGIPDGDSLNLSTCWASTVDLDLRANATLWSYVSILRKFNPV